MGDAIDVTCPWCRQTVELWIDSDVRGAFVQDCDVCCRPWRVVVSPPDGPGEPPIVSVERS